MSCLNLSVTILHVMSLCGCQLYMWIIFKGKEVKMTKEDETKLVDKVLYKKLAR